nr:hypothetical protein [Tanacetum cinerariifolium]
MPPGSPPHQPPPPPPPAGPSRASGAPGASRSSQVPPPPPPPSSTNQESQSKGSAASSSSKTAASAEYQAWTMTDIRHRPSISLTPVDLQMDEDMALDEQAQSSDDEDIKSAHIPKVNLRQDWWKPLKEERPATPEPAWSIPSSDLPVPTNNWASALASNYSPPPEDSLLAKPESRKYQPLPEVPGKGKAKRRTSTPTESSRHDESSSLYAELGLSESKEESQEVMPGADAGGQGEGQAGSNPDEQSEGQAGPDLGNPGADEQPMPSPVVHAGSDRKHMDLDVVDVSLQPLTEQMDEGFTATAYPKV